MRKGPRSVYDKWNISVVICDTDIPYNGQPSHGIQGICSPIFNWCCWDYLWICNQSLSLPNNCQLSSDMQCINTDLFVEGIQVLPHGGGFGRIFQSIVISVKFLIICLCICHLWNGITITSNSRVMTFVKYYYHCYQNRAVVKISSIFLQSCLVILYIIV